jgi:uncharacterized protein YfiM (DUF2279 family)
VKALAAVALLTLAAPARADNFVAQDKLVHASVSFAVAGITYGAGKLVLDHNAPRARYGLAALSFGAAVTIGGIKELWDGSGHGDASWGDFGADVLGAAAGAGLALTIDLAVSHRR